MTDSSELTDTVADELSEQVDVGGLVTGDDVSDQLDGESLGRSVGEVAGGMLGKRLGLRLSRWVVSKLPFVSPNEGGEPSSLGGKLANALFVALRRTFEKPEFREPVVDAVRSAAGGWRDQLESAETTAEDAAAEGADAAESAAETAEETADQAADEAADAAESTTDDPSQAAQAVADADEFDPEELQSLREETYRELLEMMEYSQLQSIAKKVGVRANKGREQMLDDIVEEFGSAEEEGTDEGEDDETANGESADADEST